MTTEITTLYSSICWKILQLRYEKRITIVEQLRAEGIVAGQLGVITWSKYINALLSTRERQRKPKQNRLNNSKME